MTVSRPRLKKPTESQPRRQPNPADDRCNAVRAAGVELRHGVRHVDGVEALFTMASIAALIGLARDGQAATTWARSGSANRSLAGPGPRIFPPSGASGSASGAGPSPEVLAALDFWLMSVRLGMCSSDVERWRDSQTAFPTLISPRKCLAALPPKRTPISAAGRPLSHPSAPSLTSVSMSWARSSGDSPRSANAMALRPLASASVPESVPRGSETCAFSRVFCVSFESPWG